jgi:CheY-like chemotaxis protein
MINPPSIFIVDDDHEDQLMLSEYFANIGVLSEIKYFDNGEITIRHLDCIEHARDLPKLIVLDLNMPVLNGTQTLLYLKRSIKYKNIPVIVFTTSENDEEKRKCLSYGAVDYVVKPMSWEEGQEIAKLLASYLG